MSALVGIVAAAAPVRAVVLEIGDSIGEPGVAVQVDVVLNTEGASVVATQNDIGYAAPLRIRARADGRPDCMAKADLDKGATVFGFLPAGCSGAACTSVRALVLAFDNVDPIPNGVTLYMCVVEIAADSPGGAFPLTISNLGASDPFGAELPTTGRDGAIVIGETLAGVITIGSTSGRPLDTVAVDVIVDPFGPGLVGTRIDIEFDPLVSIAADVAGRPRCTDYPSIDDGNASFRFLPLGCSPGTSCTAVQALVFSLENAVPVGGGLRLFTCEIVVGAFAIAGQSYPLICSDAVASDAEGNPLVVACENGQVNVADGGGPRVTATPTSTHVVAGFTLTPFPSPTRTPAAGVDDDGCQIGPRPSTAGGWLLVPAALLGWWRLARRRHG
jgi:hypothetical protein